MRTSTDKSPTSKPGRTNKQAKAKSKTKTKTQAKKQTHKPKQVERPAEPRRNRTDEDIDEAIEETFPASDPPAWTL